MCVCPGGIGLVGMERMGNGRGEGAGVVDRNATHQHPAKCDGTDPPYIYQDTPCLDTSSVYEVIRSFPLAGSSQCFSASPRNNS